MITLRHLTKTFGGQVLFERASLQMNEGDRFALVGPNGSGKSTLLKILLGRLEPDEGEVDLRRGLTFGYLPQEAPAVSPLSVLEGTLEGLPQASDRQAAKAKETLMGLGFQVSDFNRPIRSLSGGWAMRVAMARLLLEAPEVLLLDEPTNHLDLESLLWFQETLLRSKSALLLISHDRGFINATCRAVVSLEHRALKLYRGNYDAYVQAREAERVRLETAWKEQQAEIARMQDWIDRNRARASTANRAQSMMKKLEKMERIELPEDARRLKFKMPQPHRSGRTVLELQHAHKQYGDLTVYRDLSFHLERGQRMAFVGHNGAGKSTLLKMLAGVVPADQGARIVGHNVRVGYFSQHRLDMLTPGRTVLEEAQANDRGHPDQFVRTILGTFLFPGDAVFKKVEVLSGGEKSRLALVKLLLDPPNVLLLDEPTVHLDMSSVEALIAALQEYEGTLCFISHDVYFINALARQVVHVDRGRVTVYPGTFEEFQWRQRQQAPSLPSTSSAPPPRPTAARPPTSVPALSPHQEEKRRAKERDRLEREIRELELRVEALARHYQDPLAYKNFAESKRIGDRIKELQGQVEQRQSRLRDLQT